ncbi:MAG: hypothetical protein FJW20_25865 [Acidimicrobiia bacterium]|nr:hypothetical protein [Acidimicrobiia bacterium]
MDLPLYVSLSMITASWKVRLPGLKGSISPHFLVVLAGLVQLPMIGALAGLFAGIGVQMLWNSKRRPSGEQALFNMASLTIAAVSAKWILTSLLTVLPPGGVGYPLAFLVAACAYFLLNTLQVSCVICLVEGRRMTVVFDLCHSWAFPYYAAGGVLGWWLSAAGNPMHWLPWLCVMPLAYLGHRYYRVLVLR